jgi:LacI family transcriptional regulator
MGVTIRKIADVANVSRGTVDKVLNNRPGVSDRTRKRIKQIAQQLGYQPNIAGKALAFQQNPITIGVIIPMMNTFYEDIQKGSEAAYREFKDFGVKVYYEMMEQYDEALQLEKIHKLREKGINGLVLPPYNSLAIKEIINGLEKEGIRVITYNTDVQETNRLCFVGQDLYKSGRVAAELMTKFLNKEGDVFILTGFEDVWAHHIRVQGFKDVMKETHSSIQIVDQIESKDSNQITYEKTKEALQKYSHLRGIYVAAAGVLGVAKALKETGSHERVIVSCYDIFPETEQLLKENVIDFTILQDPFSQGYLPIKIFFDYFFKNKEPEEKHIKTKLEIIIKENFES